MIYGSANLNLNSDEVIIKVFNLRHLVSISLKLTRLTSINISAVTAYYMVQTLECTFIQGSDKVVMVIC